MLLPSPPKIPLGFFELHLGREWMLLLDRKLFFSSFWHWFFLIPTNLKCHHLVFFAGFETAESSNERQSCLLLLKSCWTQKWSMIQVRIVWSLMKNLKGRKIKLVVCSLWRKACNHFCKLQTKIPLLSKFPPKCFKWEEKSVSLCFSSNLELRMLVNACYNCMVAVWCNCEEFLSGLNAIHSLLDKLGAFSVWLWV